jgi:flagellin-like protein
MSKGITPVVATVLLMLIAVSTIGSASVFLDDTVEGVRSGLEDEINRQDRVENSDIRIDSAYNSTDGYLFVDVQNPGSVTLEVERNGTKLWNLYIDGKPQEWNYSDNSLDDDVSVDPNDIISFNTTVSYPPEGASLEVGFNAPYESSDSHICTNEDSNFC